MMEGMAHAGKAGMSRLDGCRVLVTRPAQLAHAWQSALERLGAKVIAYPTIEVRPPSTWQPLDDAFARLGSYHWLIFTSASAVRLSCTRLPATVDPRNLEQPLVAAVGHETARALLERGFVVARIPEDQRQEGLIAAFGDLPAGTRLLFPQAVGGRDALTAALRARGCEVDLVPASETVPVDPLGPLPEFDVATFASPSAFEAFVDRHGTAPLAPRGVVVIGPTTAAAALARGLRPEVARTPRIDDVADAIAGVACAPSTLPR
jgi:uroporphyrinogen III methyltransferase / synthase